MELKELMNTLENHSKNLTGGAHIENEDTLQACIVKRQKEENMKYFYMCTG